MKIVTALVFYKNTSATTVEAKIPIRIKEVSKEYAADLFPLIRKMPQKKQQQFIQRFNKGDRCYMAFSGMIPCHYSWIREKGTIGMHEIKRRFKIKNKDAWIFDCTTNSNYRGLSIYTKVISYITELLISNGYSNVYISTLKSNKASIRGIEKAGFSFEGKINHLKLSAK